MDERLRMWQSAVVHLECRADSKSSDEEYAPMESLLERQRSRDLSDDEVKAEIAKGRRDILSSGTAVFVKANGKRYLITARHILYDDERANRLRDDAAEFCKSWSTDMRSDYLLGVDEKAKNQTFPIIFRVPSFSQLAANGYGKGPEILQNLNCGVIGFQPYTFSEPSTDLAIVSLDSKNIHFRFGDDLEANGYVPVDLDDVISGPPNVGDDVYTVGYPDVSLVDELILTSAQQHWASSDVSEATFAFGKVAMAHPKLSYFWCDMSIYPGNSGGPVISNGHLVGIVSGQASISTEVKTAAHEPLQLISDDGKPLRLISDNRIPFGRMVHASLIRDLLQQQQQKDDNFVAFVGGVPPSET